MKRDFYKIVKEKKLGVPFEDDLERRLKDPEFRKAWQESTGDVYLDTVIEIIRARREKKLSQRELAKRIGTSQQAIARLENPFYKGRSLRILNKVANALDKKLEIRLTS